MFEDRHRENTRFDIVASLDRWHLEVIGRHKNRQGMGYLL